MASLPVHEGLPIPAPASCIFTVDEVMEYAVTFITTTCNLSEPTCCPYCFAVLAFDLGKNPATLDALQRHAYVFWETCLRLIIQYTEEDIVRLRKRLRENQLACKNRSMYHKYKLPLGTEDTFEIFMHALLFAISTGLAMGKRPAHGDRLAKFRNRKGYWPRDLYDLFPVDVERVVDGLVHWACVPSSGNPFSVLIRYLQIARAVVFPVLMAPPRRDRLLWALLQLITPDQPTVPWDGAPPFAMPAGLSMPQMLRRDEVLRDAALYTLRVVCNDVHARTGDDALFLAGREALFLDALERLDLARPVAPNMLPQFQRETRVYTTRDYICALRALLGRPHDACHPAAHHEPCPAATIHRFFVRRLDSSYCFNPGCMSAELQDYEMRAFRQCAQCRVARYCSVECQKKDWSKNEPKHKVLCGSIAELGPCVAESRARENDFVAWFDQTVEYTPELVAMLLQWTAACGLIPRSYVPVKVED